MYAVQTLEKAKTRIYSLTLLCRALPRWQLPLGLIVHPLSETHAEVPMVNLGSAGIVRCKRCRTYINPFVRWTDGGRCATPA